MSAWVIIAIVGVLAVVVLCASVRILKQYERASSSGSAGSRTAPAARG